MNARDDAEQSTLTPPAGNPVIAGPDETQGIAERCMAAFVTMQAELRSYLRSMLHNQEDADDAVQETFLIVRDRLSTYDPSRDYPNWVRGIARNVALRKRRTLSRARNLPLDQFDELNALVAAPQADAPSAAVSEITAVRTWVAQLGPEQQRMVLLRYVERLGVDAIAERLGKSEAAVYMAISRMRSSLQHSVERQRRLAATPAGQGLGSSVFGDLLSAEIEPTAADAAESTTIALRMLISGVREASSGRSGGSVHSDDRPGKEPGRRH